jgi:DNA polymerase I-like protein with 3'-5' exonuclease and polymerase domains
LGHEDAFTQPRLSARSVIRKQTVAATRGNHDELLLEVDEDDAPIVRELLEAVMIDAFATTFPGAPIKGVAEAVIGKNWMEAKA